MKEEEINVNNESSIDKLFDILSEVIKIIRIRGTMIDCYSSDDIYRGSVGRVYFKQVKNGTYYREGHELKKKLVCNAEYLDKRSDLRVKSNGRRSK